jgi:hypothetical protein
VAVWNRLTVFITGGAVTRAASDAVSPVLEPVRQHAFQKNQLRVLDPMSAARLRAQGHITDGEATDEAARSGIGQNRLEALVAMIQAAPSLGELDRMANRHKIERQDFNDALAQHLIPPQWWDGLWDLTHAKLDPVQLANAIHRGLVADPGLLAVDPPSGVGNVPAYPVYPIPALDEAQAAGLDKDRLGVLVGLMGLPMGPHEAAQAVFRGILTDTDFQRAIAEGNTRNEWAEAIFEQTRQIPTARDFFENALRGYHDLAWAQKEAERHGMSHADSLVIYQNQGRPMNVRQITQALARGGVFKPEPGELTDPYDAAIVEGNLKPAYYDLAKANRYSYSVPFWWRTLLTSSAITPDEAEQLLLNIGNPPDLARKVTDHFAGGVAGAADPHVGKAQTQLWNRAHTSYLAGEITETDARTALAEAGVAATAVDQVLVVWNHERELERKQLTPAQVKKAFRGGVQNPATGTAWTRDDALAALTARGYSTNDANTFLDL